MLACWTTYLFFFSYQGYKTMCHRLQDVNKIYTYVTFSVDVTHLDGTCCIMVWLLWYLIIMIIIIKMYLGNKRNKYIFNGTLALRVRLETFIPFKKSNPRELLLLKATVISCFRKLFCSLKNSDYIFFKISSSVGTHAHRAECHRKVQMSECTERRTNTFLVFLWTI